GRRSTVAAGPVGRRSTGACRRATGAVHRAIRATLGAVDATGRRSARATLRSSVATDATGRRSVCVCYRAGVAVYRVASAADRSVLAAPAVHRAPCVRRRSTGAAVRRAVEAVVGRRATRASVVAASCLAAGAVRAVVFVARRVVTAPGGEADERHE